MLALTIYRADSAKHDKHIMKFFTSTALVSLVCYILFGCGAASQRTTVGTQTPDATEVSLHQAYQPYFSMGVALNREQTTGKDPDAIKIVDHHFNALTPENDMKWESVQAHEGTFTFEGADALVKYATSANKTIIGHALIWHQQTPQWVFENQQGGPASRELLLARMKAHIYALAGRYKDDLIAWDVVNEALNEDGSIRQSAWFKIIGEEYIDKAFEYAAQAAPNAKLYYNDYNLFKSAKMDGAIGLAKRLKSKGIRIDGIGEQAHYDIVPPVKALALSIQKVADTGLSFMITELDVSVLAFPDSEKMGADLSLDFALQESYNPYADGLSQGARAQLADAYIDLFTVFLAHHEHIDRVTMWGVSDNNTWKNDWPMKGRTDYPLLFDRDYQPKPFVFDLIRLAQTRALNRD